MRIIDVFLACDEAVSDGRLIVRMNKQDKEFHFQNWFQAQLDRLSIAYDTPGRNTYPDFRLVNSAEGFEIKGLAYPGREASYDSNSQVPTGIHNERTVYYMFGRYPNDPDGNEFPVVDFVLCHGDFLNADHSYVHKNRSVKGFGSYGDIMIRDRKMYVAPTPFALLSGTTGQRTLILPESHAPDERIKRVGTLTRTECEQLVIGYRFDLRKNLLIEQKAPNPDAGRKHGFTAYRAEGRKGPDVKLAIPETAGCI